jgi:hypothetical protein
MDRKLCDLTNEELCKLPRLTDRNWIGEEKIYIHLLNSKKMNWFLAEYDPISKKFFGFSENRNEGIYWGLFYLQDLLEYGKKGNPWELVVDSTWKPIYAKEISALQGYIKTMLSLSDSL